MKSLLKLQTKEKPNRVLLQEGYNFAYLDEGTKRMIRRTLLKAIAIPGHRFPFGSREMPLPLGWGTGGIQITASLIGPDDVLKVIDIRFFSSMNRPPPSTKGIEPLWSN